MVTVASGVVMVSSLLLSFLLLLLVSLLNHRNELVVVHAFLNILGMGRVVCCNEGLVTRCTRRRNGGRIIIVVGVIVGRAYFVIVTARTTSGDERFRKNSNTLHVITSINRPVFSRLSIKNTLDL
jgi:hypothetical protein